MFSTGFKTKTIFSKKLIFFKSRKRFENLKLFLKIYNCERTFLKSQTFLFQISKQNSQKKKIQKSGKNLKEIENFTNFVKYLFRGDFFSKFSLILRFFQKFFSTCFKGFTQSPKCELIKKEKKCLKKMKIWKNT